MKKVIVLLALLVVAFTFAQETGTSIGGGLVALGAALAIGISSIAAAMAQAAIGSAGAGVLAERPEAFGQILIYIVIPETIVIFGFVIAFVLNGGVK